MRWGSLFLSVLVAGTATLSSADWQSIGPEGGEINHIVQSYTDGSVLFAASGTNPTTIVTSSNSGLSWSIAGSYAYTNYCMTIGPTGNLYAGSSHRIYRSTDGGVTWSYTNITNFYCYDMFAHPTNPSVVYGAGYRYNGTVWVLCFAKSTNGGTSWSLTDLETEQSYARCIAVSPSDPDVIYIGGYRFPSPYTPIMYRSTDGGSSWTDVSAAGWAGQYYVYSAAVHPTNPDILCAGLYYDIWRSTNGGASWTEVTTNYYYNFDMAWSSADPSLIYSGEYDGVYRSTNAGVSWGSYASGLDGYYFYSVAADRTNASVAFTGNSNGFFRSTNGGSTWTMSNAGLTVGKVIALGMTPGNPSRFFMQLEGVGVYRTTDNGDNWTKLGTPLSCGDFCAIAISPTDPNTVLALEGAG